MGGWRSPAETVTHALYPVAKDQKFDLLIALLERTHFDSCIIFTSTKIFADRIAHRLRDLKHAVVALHSNLTQRERVEALEALERRPYDVVLMDVQMPEVDGLDAARRICARWSADVRPHIIALTANAMPEDREACFAAGMHDYLAKPIRPNELAEALSRARPLEGDSASVEGGASLDAGSFAKIVEAARQ